MVSESIAFSNTVRFVDLHNLLLRFLRQRVSDGIDTERGIARRAGISQPHVHLSLKGERHFSPPACDRLLESLNMSVFDLLPPDAVSAAGPGAIGSALVEADVLENLIGPGIPLTGTLRGRIRFRRSEVGFATPGWPIAARLAWDPLLADLIPPCAWAVLDQSSAARREIRNDGLYLIREGDEGRIRRLRRAGNGLYLTVDRFLSRPEAWTFLGNLQSAELDAILARVWLAEPEGAVPGSVSPDPFPGGGEWG